MKVNLLFTTFQDKTYGYFDTAQIFLLRKVFQLQSPLFHFEIQRSPKFLTDKMSISVFI
jgi:hypothetical protein